MTMAQGVDTNRQPKVCRRKTCLAAATSIITVRINGDVITTVGACARDSRHMITELMDQYHGCSVSIEGRVKYGS